MIKDKIPIFVELRKINQNGINLRQLISEVIYANKFRLDEEFIEKAFSLGQFALFLDGFDEVKISKRQELSREIIKYAEYYDNWIVVSSRPDNALEGWDRFSKFDVAPLTMDQADELIRKLPFDDELKKKFQIDLCEGLFNKHKSFLSNPLLLSIMLLTYGQGAHIPTKLNVFYNQAYEALFQRHDALKGGFQREIRTQLDIQDFGRVFSAFSLQTYDKTEIEFSRMQALDYIDKAKDITQLEFNNDNYLYDALQAVCLLVEDGLMIVFAHRSFQEYFTARFIAEAKPEIQKHLVEKYSKKVKTDAVIKLLYEIRPDVVELYYIIPGIAELREIIQVKDKVNIGNYASFIRGTIAEITLQKNSFGYSYQTHYEGLFNLMTFLINNCGYIVNYERTSKRIRYESSQLWEKYGHGKNKYVINIKEFDIDDEFFNDLLYFYPILFSLEELQAVIKIGEVLEEKRKATDESLEKIIG